MKSLFSSSPLRVSIGQTATVNCGTLDDRLRALAGEPDSAALRAKVAVLCDELDFCGRHSTADLIRAKMKTLPPIGTASSSKGSSSNTGLLVGGAALVGAAILLAR